MPGSREIGPLQANLVSGRDWRISSRRWGGVGIIQDAGPLAGQAEQCGPLVFAHVRPTQALWRQLRVRVAGAKHQIAHVVVDRGGFQLVRRECGNQVERFIVLPA